MQRVMILGGSGAGKSTLAKRLCDLTGFPVLHMDNAVLRDDMTFHPSEDVYVTVHNTAANGNWIIDGNCLIGMEARLDRADCIVFIYTPTYKRVWRLLMRIAPHYHGTRSDLPGNSESLGRRYLFFPELFFTLDRVRNAFFRATKFASNMQPKLLKLMANQPDAVQCVHLNTPDDIERFLDLVAVEFAAIRISER